MQNRSCEPPSLGMLSSSNVTAFVKKQGSMTQNERDAAYVHDNPTAIYAHKMTVKRSHLLCSKILLRVISASKCSYPTWIGYQPLRFLESLTSVHPSKSKVRQTLSDLRVHTQHGSFAYLFRKAMTGGPVPLEVTWHSDCPALLSSTLSTFTLYDKTARRPCKRPRESC